MPSKNTNIIGQLRGKHDPHYKLAARVDLNHDIIHGIEKKLTDLPKIHSTLSKSFGMQRKTLRRVMGLEGIQSSLLFRVIGLEEVVTGDARKRPKGEPEGKRPLSRKGPDPKKSRRKRPQRGRGRGTGAADRPRPLNMLDGPGAFDRGGRYTDGARQKVGVRDDWGDIDDGWSGTSGRDGADGLGGARGADGLGGAAGADGLGGAGADGLGGAAGADGLGGADGADGFGIDGLGGADGTSGLGGADGTSGLGGSDGLGAAGAAGAAGRDGAAGRPLQMLDGPGAFDRDRGFRRTRIRAEDLKRGSSQETIEERLERLERNKQESKAGEEHTGSIEHIETTAGVDAETGEPLSAEERKKRFKIRTGKIKAEDIKKGSSVGGAEKVAADTTGASDLAIRKGKPDVSGSDLVPPEAEGEESEGDKPEKNILSGLGKHVSKIADTVDSIYETLQSQFNEQKDTKEDARVQKEQKDAEKQEKNLEKGGLGKGIQKAAKEVFKPFTSIWDKFVNFLKTILVGKVVMKILDWFGNPENADRAKSLVRFLKDWWPVLLASVMAFMPALLGTGGMIIGTVILLAWAIPKIIDAVKWVMNVPNMIGNFLKGGAKDTDKLEKDSLKELESETKGLDPTAGEEGGKDPLDEAKAEQGGEKPPLEFDKQSDLQKVEPVKMNEGGSVPGKGDKDTVPAMLTPGEFVMSKDAVEKYGTNTLAGMNAAAGGTNIPTLGPTGDEKKDKKQPNYMIPHFSGGGKGKAVDKSHYGTPGYRIGQIMPDQYVYSKDTFVHKMVTKGDEVVKNEKSLTSIGGAIGKPDMIAHQKQLVGEIQKVEGYEDINIIDVMERPNDRGRLIDMPDEVLYPILNSSDAYKATQAKMDAAHKIDLESRGFGDGSKGYSMMYNGGGLVANNLVQHLNQGGLVQNFNQGGMVQNMFGGAKTAFNMLPQVRAAKWLGGKAKDMFSRGKEFIGNALDKSAGIPPPTTGNKVKILPLPAPGGPSTSEDNTAPPGTSIPTFSVVHPGNKSAKQKTLGITN